METGTADLYCGDNYDHRDRLCHTYAVITTHFNRQTRYAGHPTCVYRNTLTGHTSLMDGYFFMGPELHTPIEVFTVRGLLRKAR